MTFSTVLLQVHLVTHMKVQKLLDKCVIQSSLPSSREFSTKVDSRELSQSKTESTRAAGSCRGTSTPVYHDHADKAQCSSSTEHASCFLKGGFRKRRCETHQYNQQQLLILTLTPTNTSKIKIPLWQSWGSLSSQQELGNKKSHRETPLCQNICSPILAHGTCYMQLVANSTRRWKT